MDGLTKSQRAHLSSCCFSICCGWFGKLVTRRCLKGNIGTFKALSSRLYCQYIHQYMGLSPRNVVAGILGLLQSRPSHVAFLMVHPTTGLLVLVCAFFLMTPTTWNSLWGWDMALIPRQSCSVSRHSCTYLI